MQMKLSTAFGSEAYLVHGRGTLSLGVGAHTHARTRRNDLPVWVLCPCRLASPQPLTGPQGPGLRWRVWIPWIHAQNQRKPKLFDSRSERVFASESEIEKCKVCPF